ncbi:MAG: histidine phosphatase family protein [Pseudomonadota bacterium]
MKRTLILMRHGKSDWGPEFVRDFDRPLRPRGQRAAARMGRWLRENALVPDVLVTSTAKRAWQTALLVQPEVELPCESLIRDERIYDASLQSLLYTIAEHGGERARLMLIGHNPGFDYLVMHLSAVLPALTANGKLMTTAAVAVLESGSAWDALGQGCCAQASVTRPRELE